MKYFLTIIYLCLKITSQVFGQDSVKTSEQVAVKTNPIIFGEIGFGFALAGISGPQATFGLNYQIKNSLLTARYTGIADLKLSVLAPIIPFPILVDQGHADEYAVLYGLRSIKEGRSLSFSLGISENVRIAKYTDFNNQQYINKSSYVGLPFEINVKWFKKKKERYKIYYVFPVGKPTGLSQSFGLKLSGNLSKSSYLAFGLVAGLGYHKHY